MNFHNYVNTVKAKLSPRRFEHSLRVVDTALEMVGSSGVNRDKVAVAALLHDFAKDLPPGEMLALARQQGLVTCRAEEVQPDLLHGPVGAYLCHHELKVADEDVLQAIRYHTTGCVEMRQLDIIIYLADLIEPGRTYKGSEELRRLCRVDLKAALLYAFDATLRYVLNRKLLVHPMTVEARNWLLLSHRTKLEESYGE